MKNKYYVYLHRTKEIDKVFYVGSGCGKRAESKAGRSVPWNKVVDNDGWYFVIVKDNMSIKDARELELKLINHYQPDGNVRFTSIESKSFDEDINYILNTFEYSEDSPSGLIYKQDSKMKGRKIKLKGEVAGSLHIISNRYRISIKNKRRLTYRIVWLLCMGEDPVDFTIDHIDGDPLNNKISNLRKVTQEINSKNTSIRKDNKTGYVGVSYRNGYYSVSLVLFGKKSSKSFSVLKHGEDLALALAVEYRHRMITNSVNMGEHYTNKHTEGYCPNKSIDLKSSYDVDKLLTDPRMNANNKSGIPNISYLVRNGKTTIVASKTIKGKIKTKKMSVDRYGFEFSINELKMWLKEISL